VNRPTRLIALAALLCAHAQGQTLLRLDASAPAAVPTTGHLKLGSAAAPGGHMLAANSQYLLRDGQPWLPVMGEFHYSRSPAASWAAELAKMKAAGVDIVASYVIWNHHEAEAGRFDWTGNRDLRRFVQLAAQAGLKVLVRLGPWAHGEARYGGLPDWIVDALPTRRDDPDYLAHVEHLYAQIGAQLRGQLWKDGGPVVGVQLENEYNLTGPGRGEGHIRTLKALALKAGLDVPLYTVTGWDGTVYPSGEVTPVFGGYPDEPWGTPTTELPPKETYAFRFDTRVSGDLGAQTQAHAPGTAETDMDRVPFLGAEYGAGLPAMYRRRTLVSPDDIASMLPVQLGSGVNLLGYYMFHGGRNPVSAAGTGLEESTLSGGYNDTPRISYDFNAPLGPDGQQRPVLQRLRPLHYFLHDFGARLATMTVRKPDVTPDSPADLARPRWSVRSRGDSGFLFFNNHVRQYPMPAQRAVRFSLQLPGRTLTLPSRPVDIADGAYFVWPFGLDLDGVALDYATAQPIARLDAGRDGIVYLFSASDGIPAEFSIGGALRTLEAGTGMLQRIGEAKGRAVSVLLLSPTQARQLSIVELGGQRRAVLSAQQVSVEQGRLQLRSVGEPSMSLAVYPALARPRADGATLRAAQRQGVLQWLEAALPARDIAVTPRLVRAAGSAPPVQRGGLAGAALQPVPEAFAQAASWRLELSGTSLQGLDDALLELDFVGDIGRLFAGTRLLDDWYFNGQRWQVGLKNIQALLKQPLSLSVLPLRADAPIYIDRAHRPDFADKKPQVAELRGASVKPVYRLAIAP
jgi:beta-galactosidase